MNRAVCTLCLTAALTMPGLTHAQDAAELAGIRQELAQLNETLSALLDAFTRQTEGQKLQLLLQRMEITSQRAATLEAELTSARATRSSLQDQLARSQEHLENFNNELSSGAREISSEEADGYNRSMLFEIGRQQESLRDADARIAELENRLATARRELEEWQSYVDRELGGL